MVWRNRGSESAKEGKAESIRLSHSRKLEVGKRWTRHSFTLTNLFLRSLTDIYFLKNSCSTVYSSPYTFKYCLVFLVCSKCVATCKTHLKRVFGEGVKRQMEERQRSRHMEAGVPSGVGSLVKVQITRAAEVKEEEDGG